MFEDAEDGEADSDGDAGFEVPEDCAEENEGHEGEGGDVAEADEEEDVGWCFFEEGVGYYCDHGGKDAFLCALLVCGDRGGGKGLRVDSRTMAA